MIVKYIIAIILIILAALLNFKPTLVSGKIFKKDSEEQAKLKIKLIAAAICIFDFILVMIWF